MREAPAVWRRRRERSQLGLGDTMVL